MGCSHFVKISKILLFIRLYQVPPPVHPYNGLLLWMKKLQLPIRFGLWTCIFAHNRLYLLSLHPTRHNNLIIIIVVVVVVIIIIIKLIN
jgi:hypothetical protein